MDVRALSCVAKACGCSTPTGRTEAMPVMATRAWRNHRRRKGRERTRWSVRDQHGERPAASAAELARELIGSSNATSAVAVHASGAETVEAATKPVRMRSARPLIVSADGSITARPWARSRRPTGESFSPHHHQPASGFARVAYADRQRSRRFSASTDANSSVHRRAVDRGSASDLSDRGLRRAARNFVKNMACIHRR